MGNCPSLCFAFHYPLQKNSLSREGIESDIKRFEDFVSHKNFGFKIVTDSTWLDNKELDIVFQKLINRSTENFLLFFTGHYIDDSLVMPYGEKIKFSTIIDLIERRCKFLGLKINIYCIMDCCKFKSCILPYKLGESQGYVSTEIESRIILISSSSEYEKSINTKKGSSFSNIIFPLLYKDLETFEDISETTRILLQNQTPQIYSNVPWLCAVGNNRVNKI